MGTRMTSLLLDTHTLLWWWTDDARLSAAARQAIAAPGTRVFVSSASAWEVATKARLGRLAGVPSVGERFGELVAADSFEHLPVNYRHALKAGSYTQPHRDPFDRMLAAQCSLEGLTLVTSDEKMTAFEIPLFW